MEVKPPVRRFDVRFRVQGDTWADVQDKLEQFAFHVIEHGPECELVSGGVTSGGYVEIIEDATITPEVFQERLHAYNEARKAKKAGAPGGN